MSGKSIRFSIYAILLFVAVVFGIIFLFKFNFLMGIVGIVLLIFPAKLQRIALDESSGTMDKVIAKFVVPTLAVVVTLFAIMSLVLWIK